ncbi:hypothetical protein BDZ90DRAFT_275473 [Jaminaea rosea]|uniref:Uncharacterized protein n=1 Tax=Jaminaea rosea TaxID=1569628 RepID=A0A316UN41_9BASI|nr:hypothetical protein BDZ90DRAFT_275473 [Jaminaea rosea]PWN26374.1 hypothetical protein BDZ90DRAFT_275473 [Jaminaea rosea]
MVASRLALNTSRAALRRGVVAARTPVPRFSSSSSSSSGAASSAAETAKKFIPSSDAPWAISSALIFGSLFIYATSPSSKTHNEHGHITGAAHKPAQHGAGSSASDDKTGDDAVWKLEGGGEEKHEQTRTPEEADGEDEPEGNKHLADHAASKEAPEQKSPAGRDPSNETSGKENSNFQSGLKHAKDGDPVSDPKRVVAAANAAKQEKKAAKEGEKGELPEEEGEGDE